MMKFYFLNSYQQSRQGFQLSMMNTSDLALESVTEDKITSDAVRCALTKSGAVCLMGASGGEEYFLLRGLEVTDAEDRIWYINFAATAPGSSHMELWNFAANVLLNYAQFLVSLKNWFFATPAEGLSYEVRKEAVRAWLQSAPPVLLEKAFYQKPHFAAEQFCKMLESARQEIRDRLFLLVPESTMSYFWKQNEALSGENPMYQFRPAIFWMLLKEDPALFLQKDGPKEASQMPTLQQLGFTEEQSHKLVAATAVAAGAIAVFGGIQVVKKMIKRRPSGRKKNG